ncbi:transposase [Rhabdochlamydiaceae symbiont of Dictyostelium giganteum]|uniref:transposase n=1 Tax=Rhabdochlamydiaceae symbiont of Dictyostelium giganteum TaxID=3342349 RepID=UPI00384BFF71
MPKKRRVHSAEFKLKAVMEILKGEKTMAQLAGDLEVHPLLLSSWKKQFLEEGPRIFEKRSKSSGESPLETKEKVELFEQIGRLKMEVEWLKKKLKILT